MGSVHLVLLSADAYYACLTHALSNEEEEVMGLCIGEILLDVKYSFQQRCHCVGWTKERTVLKFQSSNCRTRLPKSRYPLKTDYIRWGTAPWCSDMQTQKSDFVMGYEIVMAGDIGIPHHYLGVIVIRVKLMGKPSEPFGELGSVFIMYGMFKKYGKRMRIVGWYHSHPKITVWPSHVDTATQAMYQMMDETFVGLIFSCFNEDKPSSMQSVHVTCFQSVPGPEWNPMQQDRVEIPVAIHRSPIMGPECSVALKDLPKILMQEEDDMYEKAVRSSGDDFMTRLHNSSVHVQALCKLNSNFLLPMLLVTERRNVTTQQRTKKVEDDIEALKSSIDSLKRELGES